MWPTCGLKTKNGTADPTTVELSLSVALPKHVGCASHITRNFGGIQLGWKQLLGNNPNFRLRKQLDVFTPIRQIMSNSAMAKVSTNMLLPLTLPRGFMP